MYCIVAANACIQLRVSIVIVHFPVHCGSHCLQVAVSQISKPTYLPYNASHYL
mgnify:CR=1 FL=1